MRKMDTSVSVDAWVETSEAKAQRTQIIIAEECDAVKELLLAKNREYGNSAMEPIGVFSNQNAENQIRVRIDDKLKRIQNFTRSSKKAIIHEDTEQDLIGYLILMRVCRRLNLGDVQLAS